MIDLRRWTLAAAMAAAAGQVLAQTSAPATASATREAPASAPATSPARPRHVLAMPPGFEKLETAGFTLLYRPEDADWVRRVAQAYAPATQPSTMPADLVARVKQQRPAVEAQIRRDFVLPAATSFAPLFDESILPALQRLESYRLPVFYLITTKAHLRDLLKSGEWSDPAFHYNRVADEVVPGRTVLDLSRPADDTVRPVLYEAAWDQAKRQDAAVAELRSSQAQLARLISGKAQYDLHMMIVEFLDREGFGPLQLSADQRWFSLGSAIYSSCDYAEQLTGAARRELLAMTLLDLQRIRINLSSVDVLHPTDAAAMRPQYVAAYQDAFRRKSILLVRKWLEKGGRESLPRVLERIKKSKPADGVALLELIKSDCGVDLAADAAAR